MNILLPFFDDSSLFLAVKLYNNFIYYINCNVIFLYIHENKNLSDRQLSLLSDSYVVYKCNIKYFYDAEFLSNFDLVIYSKLPCSLFDKNKLYNTDKYFTKRRPYFLSMTSGIDFTPEKGIKNRYSADGICIPNDIIRHKYNYKADSNQDFYKYHPYFCLENHFKIPQQIKNIYFFAQAIIPDTLSERINIILILIEISKKYPEKNIFIKLRSLKEENQHHTHKEIFSYEDILKICSEHNKIPNNLSICTKNMEECLKDADFCITCNSTAGIESLCKGIPTAFYLDFSYNKGIENIIKNSKLYFENSNLLYSKNNLIDLKIKEPNHNWILKNFCKRDDINEIFNSVKVFNENYRYSSNEYKDTQKIYKILYYILLKLEYCIVNILSPRKRKKLLLNRKEFFVDSKNIIINLYWKFIGSNF